VESGRWGRNGDFVAFLFEEKMKSFNLPKDGLFSFLSNRNFGKERKWREKLGFSFFDKKIVKTEIIRGEGEFNNWVFGLKRLDENRGRVEMAAADATDDLGQKFESAFFGGVIGEGKARVGLDNADGGEVF